MNGLSEEWQAADHLIQSRTDGKQRRSGTGAISLVIGIEILPKAVSDDTAQLS